MKILKSICFCAATFFAVGVSSASAGLVLMGVETSTAGRYRFTFDQEMGLDPVQTRPFIPLSFSVDIPGLTINSTSGTFTDGTTVMGPALLGWTDASPAFDAPSINPNLITSTNSGPIFASGDAGIDFSVTNVEWRFTSAESFAGTPLTGFVRQAQAIPEPSSIAILGLATAGLIYGRIRRRRRRETA